MGARGFETDILENWSIGVITAVLSDRLPDGAVPAARNSQFYGVGPETAIFGTRKGCEVQNDTAFDGEIVSQWHLHTDTINKHLVVLDNGDLGYLDSGGAFNLIDAGLFTDTSGQFSWQTFNNYAYVVNGVDAFKTNGTDSFSFGILQPDSGDWTASAVGGGANLPAGDYDVAIAYYNSNTNHTGPISAIKTVTVGGGQQISVALPNNATIADPQVDFVKIFLRRQSTQNNLFLVVAGTDVPITGTNGWPPNTTVLIDATSGQISAFRILAPDVNENYPPPDGVELIFAHKQRMFAVVGNDVYYSEIGDPENYNLNNFEPIGEDDGEPTTSLSVLSDSLIVFKRNSIFAIIGDDPATWSVQLANKTVGATAHSSVGRVNNRLWFMSLRGPQMWADIGAEVSDITTQLIGPQFNEEHIDPDNLADSVIVIHPVQHYVGWAVTPAGEDFNSIIIPFNYKLERWMASEWNMVDVRSCTLVTDDNGRAWPMVGDYDGFIYKVGVGGNDGTPTGIISSGILTAASLNAFSDSTATWPVNGLVGRFVYVWTTANGPGSAQRRKIISNTSDTITVSEDFSPYIIVGDVYIIGGVLLDWFSAFRHGGQPMLRKRIEFVFLEMEVTEEGGTCDVKVYKDGDMEVPILTRTITMGVSDVWDEFDWDEGHWASAGTHLHRLPIRAVGHTWQTRITCMSSGEQTLIRRVGVQWLTKSKKIGMMIDG